MLNASWRVSIGLWVFALFAMAAFPGTARGEVDLGIADDETSFCSQFAKGLRRWRIRLTTAVRVHR